METKRPLLRRRDLVKLLDVPYGQIDRWLIAGILPTVKIGKGRNFYRPEDVERVFKIKL